MLKALLKEMKKSKTTSKHDTKKKEKLQTKLKADSDTESGNKSRSIISPYYNYFKPIMKEVTLNVVERIMMIGMFNLVKNDAETLRAVLDDIKNISLSDEEKKEINIQDVIGEDGKVASLKWDKSIDKTVTLQEKTVKFVLEFIKTKSDNKELGVADAALLEIQSKLQ